MSKEEIVKIIKEMIQWSDHNTYKMALQGLLDLYNKEKEKNKELIEGQIKTLEEILQPQLLKKYVSKDKIKERYEKLKHYDYIEIKELLKLLEE
jgi:hypothetical protein